MERRALARAIFEASYLTGTFTLRSGATSHEYFDKYRFEANPTLLRTVGEALAPHVPADTQALAGLETGGIPLAVILGQVTGLPTRFVRKKTKSYGTRELAEGGAIADMRLLVVEDVVTSGGQIASSVRDLRDRGAVVGRALCVIDRSAGATSLLERAGITMHALFRMDELLAAAVHDSEEDVSECGGRLHPSVR